MERTRRVPTSCALSVASSRSSSARRLSAHEASGCRATMPAHRVRTAPGPLVARSTAHNPSPGDCVHCVEIRLFHVLPSAMHAMRVQRAWQCVWVYTMMYRTIKCACRTELTEKHHTKQHGAQCVVHGYYNSYNNSSSTVGKTRALGQGGVGGGWQVGKGQRITNPVQLGGVGLGAQWRRACAGHRWH